MAVGMLLRQDGMRYGRPNGRFGMNLKESAAMNAKKKIPLTELRHSERGTR